MSGGHWNYLSSQIINIADDIDNIISKNGKEYTKEELKNEFEYRDPDWYEKYPEDKFRHKYPDNVIDEFKKASKILRLAAIYEKRIDWLLSGDNGNESFIEQLTKDLENEKKRLE